MRSNILQKISWLLLTALCVLAAPPSTSIAYGQPALPNGEGRDLVSVACTQCHALGSFVSLREGRSGWNRHLSNMVLRGAQLDKKEFEAVLEYMTANFGPGQSLPDAKPVKLPEGAGKETVETMCALCHSLERVVAVPRRQKDWDRVVHSMFERYGSADQEMQRSILSYLNQHLGR